MLGTGRHSNSVLERYCANMLSRYLIFGVDLMELEVKPANLYGSQESSEALITCGWYITASVLGSLGVCPKKKNKGLVSRDQRRIYRILESSSHERDYIWDWCGRIFIGLSSTCSVKALKYDTFKTYFTTIRSKHILLLLDQWHILACNKSYVSLLHFNTKTKKIPRPAPHPVNDIV